MRKLRILVSARNDLVHILKSVGRESGSATIGERAVQRLRERCGELANLPGTMGLARPELFADLRSVAAGSFVIFFRYTPTHFEVVAIINGRRDMEATEARLRSVLKQ